MKIVDANTTLLLLDSMYPCSIRNIDSSNPISGIGEDLESSIPVAATAFGVVLDGVLRVNLKTKQQQVVYSCQYFCLPSKDIDSYIVDGHVVMFIRYGFQGQYTIGGPIEKTGRLTYIDNCSSSLLVYPPRKGDPSMSMLNFPKNVLQTDHIHPSFRLGVVIEGFGLAVYRDNEVQSLAKGTVFCMEEREIHRFVTTDSTLSFVSFHPDGNWGPEDETHPVMSRTYIEDKWKR